MGASYTSNMNTAEANANGTLMGSHLKSPSDITSLPFFPAGTGSLLQKCLTPQVWEACKDRRDRFGFTFQ